jgi:hypothetical protein
MTVAERERDESLSPLQAYRALEDFGRQNGPLRLMLLAHCAVPEQVRPDLVNLIKVNFLPESGSDLSVDADVLFSSAFEPIGADFYRMEPEIRRQCLSLLDAAYRWDEERRSNQVARLLLRYLDRVETEPDARADPVFAEIIDLQRWGAVAFLDPTTTARAMAQALEKQANFASGTHFRLRGLAAAVSIPLAGHQHLLAYARGLDAKETGDIGLLRDLRSKFAGQILEVEGVRLPLEALFVHAAGPDRPTLEPLARANIRVFLSCVIDEFAADRDALRHELTGKTVEVKVQEDFVSFGGDTLSKLDAYIDACDAVIHLVGAMTGDVPPLPSVAEFLRVHPDFANRLPAIAAALDAGERISYTQWEAWLAILHRKPLLIAAHDAPLASIEASQVSHVERLRALDGYPVVRFASRDQLCLTDFHVPFPASAASLPAHAQAHQPAARVARRTFQGAQRSAQGFACGAHEPEGSGARGAGSARDRRRR